MFTHIEDENTYVAFEVKSNVFAIPIKEILGIIRITQNVPRITLPNTKNYVKCIVEVDGLLVTVINIPGTGGGMPSLGDLIVVLEHIGQRIGISADTIYLVTISLEEIVYDKVSGTKAFMRGGKTYSILDDIQLYKYLDV